jgi:hypothetical protein
MRNLRGAVAGGAAGLLSSIVAYMWVEPVLIAAIALEGPSDGCCCGTPAKHPEVDALAHSRPGSAFGWAPGCGLEGPPSRMSSGTGELVMRHLVQSPMAVAGMVEHEGAR